MKKAMLLILLLCFSKTQSVSAKMSIIPPQDMLSRSDYIIVGSIITSATYRNYRSNYRETTMLVEDVLKGQFKQKEIVLKRDIHFHPGEIPYVFPEPGTKVLLLLRSDDYGLSLTYHNSICVIENRRLSLFEGIGFGKWTVSDYVDTYQAFFDSVRVNEER